MCDPVSGAPDDAVACQLSHGNIAMLLRWCWTALLLALPCFASAESPWGEWPLRRDLQDTSGHGRHAVTHHGLALDSEAGVEFFGSSPGLEVSLPEAGLLASSLRISCWVQTSEPLKDDFGTLLSAWNGAERTGFHLSLRNNSGCTSSQSNYRQLEFGVDAGSEPTWRDEGRPGQALLGFAMCNVAGELYVSTCEAGTGAGHVYRYGGPGQWIDLGSLDGSNAVSALAAYQGSLYAGTGKYRLSGSAVAESENSTMGGHVYRYAGSDGWQLVGTLPDTEAVAALTVFDGRLYASSLYKPAGLFRYEADGQWTRIPTPDDKRVQALRVHDGYLYATSYDGGRVYRFSGENWEDLGNLADNTQTYSFAGYNGGLWVGTWPSGRVYELGPDSWIDRGRLDDELEVMAMGVYNGTMYAGSLPLAKVYRYSPDDTWTSLKQLDETPDVKYRRVWTMANFQGRAFFSTLPSGKIWSMSAGSCVTDDHELSPGWHHIVAEASAKGLRLTVDGKLRAESTGPVPAALVKSPTVLKIGDGPNGPFLGRLRDLKLEQLP